MTYWSAAQPLLISDVREEVSVVTPLKPLQRFELKTNGKCGITQHDWRKLTKQKKENSDTCLGDGKASYFLSHQK